MCRQTSLHFLFLTILLLFNSYQSQFNYPLTGWTQVTSDPMPYAAATLFIGYQPSSDKIWLIGDDNEMIMSYTIGTQTWQYNGTFSASLAMGTVNAQSYAQWGDNIIVFVNDGILRQFSFTDVDITTTNKPLTYNREAPCVAAIYPDWIFATGGVVVTTDIETAGQESSVFQIYDNTGVSWSQGPDMNNGRTKHACVIHNNYLYVFGGSYYSGTTGYDRTTS
eukprot:458810_1